MTKVIALLCLMCITWTGKAQQGTLILSPRTSSLTSVGQSIYLLQDTSHRLSLQDILTPTYQQQFIRSRFDVPAFANTRATIWCRFTLQNQTLEECLLELSCAGIHYVELYIPDSLNQYQSQQTGFLLPFRQRDYQVNTFITRILKARDTDPRTFYLKINSGGTILLNLKAGTAKAMAEARHRTDVFYGMYFGWMLVIIIFNFFIYLFLRQKVYLYYILSVIGFGVFNSSINIGYTFEFLWPQYPWLNYYLNSWLAVGCIFLIAFTSSFLETRTHTPRLHKGFFVLIPAFVLVIVLNLLQQFTISRLLAQLASFFMIGYLLYTSVACYRRGVQQARFYIMAQSILLAGGIVLLLMSGNVLPSTFFTNNALLMGTALESILFAFAFADRVRLLQIASRKAEAERLQWMQNQNIHLEKLVQERTEEITTQNEELSQTQEEMAAQRDILFTQNEQLKKAQELISAYTQNLEAEVKHRTEELQQANDTLIRYNLQLEQFAFITAHNLRSPVARILGLGSLLELPDAGPADQAMVVKEVGVAVRKLDEVIKDLSFILEINKTSDAPLTRVALAEEMEKVFYLLADEIKDTDARIVTDFAQAPYLESLSVYIHNILYNLVSNAIKYRHPDRRPEIRIQSQGQGEFFCLTVSDNGLGIDLSAYGSQLFSLYKRFHFHVGGKGMGLYLVKTQVTAMGGRIEVESNLQQGTTFYVYLPQQPVEREPG